LVDISETALKLTASDDESNDWFGQSVSVSGNYALIAASLDDDNDVDSGSAYIFRRSGGTWNQVSKLTASEGEANDFSVYQYQSMEITLLSELIKTMKMATNLVQRISLSTAA
jgi:hypothetical protein